MGQRLRILHISDLHIRGDREKEAWRRRRVLGDAWKRNLDEVGAAGPVDLVAFTGDLAFSGRSVEYEEVGPFLDEVLSRLKCPRERLFVVPGNHDVDRSVVPASWEELRGLLRPGDAQEFSQWMASPKEWAPRGFRASMRDEVLSRQAAYREWVGRGLGRPGLLPSAGLHPRLGYRETLRLPGHPFAVHVIGLDSAWLAGDDNDSGRLWLTEDQVMRLATEEGRELAGVRLALIHHPLEQLVDGAHARRLLAGHVDVLLRGHLHEAEAVLSEEPSSALRSLAAGCLYESDRYPNSCQLIQLTVDGQGRPEACEVWFRSWSARGHWHSDDSQYRGTRGGWLRWPFVPREDGGPMLNATAVSQSLNDAAFRQAVGAPSLHPVPGPAPAFLQTRAAALPKAHSPAALLNARYQVVPFHEETRQAELRLLSAWCTEEGPFSIRLFTGSGGAGKTRLLMEWCSRLRSLGWQAGFLPRAEADMAVHLRRLDAFLDGTSDPVLLVVDEAEVRPTLRAELHHLQQRGGRGPPVRVALLARQEGDWWQWLKEQDEVGDLVSVALPTPLSSVAVEGPLRSQVFEAARAAFAALLGKAPASAALPDFSAALFGQPLFLHMAALADVEGLPLQATHLLDEILSHEEGFWRGQLAGINDFAALSLQQAARRVVAAVTLRGGTGSAEETDQLIKMARGPDSADFREMLRRLYPGTGSRDAPNAYLRGLTPDVLGEGLVDRVLSDVGMPRDYLKRIFEGAGQEALRTGFLVLGVLSLQRADTARWWLEEVLNEDVPGRAMAALEAALALGKRSAFGQLGGVLSASMRQRGTVEMAKAMEAMLPERAVSLMELARWTCEVQLERLPASTQTLRARARLLTNLGAHLGALGRLAEALKVTQEAVQHHRTFAKENPGAFLPDFAASLNNLGAQLNALGRREEALAVAQEALSLRRTLAKANAALFLPDLAGGLNNMGVHLSALGRREEALEATREAVSLRRTLAKANPAAILPDLAASLNNLGARLSDLGRREEALEATQEAVSLRRTLAKANPAAILPDLAASLSNLGNQLSELGRHAEALEVTQEAVQHHRTLARAHPDTFLPQFASSLNNLGVKLRALGQHAEALEVTQEAVQHHRALAKANPKVFLPRLAASLTNFGGQLSELGRHDESLEATQEAVQHHRALAKENPEVFLPRLATSLTNLGTHLHALGRHEDALEPLQEAVQHHRSLTKANPAAILPDLAASLTNFGGQLSELGRHAEALEATQEAVSLRRTLATAHPEAFLPGLAVSLNNLGIHLSELGRHEEGLEVTQEAVQHHRALAKANPKVFLPRLAASLNNLGNQLSELGRHDEALHANQEAVRLQDA